jgi:C-terminal processing protease CtpA/Prc
MLIIKTFDSDLLKEKYKQNYNKVFDSLFKQINRHQIKNLILDLRDNQGGNFYPGQTLLSYLVSAPSRFLLDGKEATIIQPKAARFKGKLFVLMNGGSFSNTAIVCACLKRDRRPVFIGEETGGNAHVISGDPEEFILPQTKIKAYISTVTYRIVGDNNDGHGVKPDHSILLSVEDFLTGKDAAKALALQLIPD